MKIIIINGSGGAGKDTVVELCTTYLREDFYVKNISTIDKVKQIARDMDWNGEKDDKGRRFLADLKDAWTRYNNGANESVLREVKEFETEELYAPKEYVIFIHCREPEAIDWFIEKFEHTDYEYWTLLVERKDIEEFNNESDKRVNEFYYDLVLTNNGSLEDLEKKCKVLSDCIKGKLNFWDCVHQVRDNG